MTVVLTKFDLEGGRRVFPYKVPINRPWIVLVVMGILVRFHLVPSVPKDVMRFFKQPGQFLFRGVENLFKGIMGEPFCKSRYWWECRLIVGVGRSRMVGSPCFCLKGWSILVVVVVVVTVVHDDCCEQHLHFTVDDDIACRLALVGWLFVGYQ